MAEGIATLKAKRGVLRASVTKCINKLETELRETAANENEIEELLEQLDDKWKSLKVVDDELESFFSSEDFVKEFPSIEEYREKVVMWKFRGNKFLRMLDSSANKVSKTEVAPVHNEELRTDFRYRGTVKLPKITIPKFYGDVSQWLTFWNSFETAIHANEHLDEIDKFNYLKAHLGRTALGTIEGFSISAENYGKAVKLLSDRFARKDILINAHMNNLMNLPSLKRSDDTKAFRKLYDNFQTQIRSLESLGICSENYSAMMCPMLLKLFPHDLVFDFKKKFTSCDYNIKDLTEFLAAQLCALECANASINHPEVESFTSGRNNAEENSNKFKKERNENKFRQNYSNSCRKDPRKNKGKNFSTAEFMTAASVENEMICLFCQG
ncbi:uncharacterized protein LOC129222459 [Uloborus diversus]|uniref:uncharacterized protein LOC129222459 n=1 Tax=Uloborus diversus TaxID=327109 RepID=UPI00240A2B2C|nr:uncharacterized protein LOC129222459 [Uloborus diversus]